MRFGESRKLKGLTLTVGIIFVFYINPKIVQTPTVKNENQYTEKEKLENIILESENLLREIKKNSACKTSVNQYFDTLELVN